VGSSLGADDGKKLAEGASLGESVGKSVCKFIPVGKSVGNAEVKPVVELGLIIGSLFSVGIPVGALLGYKLLDGISLGDDLELAIELTTCNLRLFILCSEKW